MKNTHRKGQMEIMGLIIIVILLTLGMFFIVSFKTQKPQVEVKKNYEQDQLASNFIIAFLKTNTECSNYDIKSMIQDCAKDKNIYCKTKDSCQYVEDAARTVLDKTFEEWGKNYSLRIEGVDNAIAEFDTCEENADRDSAFQPISLYPYPGTVVVKLDICGG